jgi:hypothetical protein
MLHLFTKTGNKLRKTTNKMPDQRNYIKIWGNKQKQIKETQIFVHPLILFPLSCVFSRTKRSERNENVA